jgi:hypothetical protein
MLEITRPLSILLEVIYFSRRQDKYSLHDMITPADLKDLLISVK